MRCFRCFQPLGPQQTPHAAITISQRNTRTPSRQHIVAQVLFPEDSRSRSSGGTWYKAVKPPRVPPPGRSLCGRTTSSTKTVCVSCTVSWTLEVNEVWVLVGTMFNLLRAQRFDKVWIARAARSVKKLGRAEVPGCGGQDRTRRLR